MHIPVLLDEVIRFLNPQSNQNFIDCTLGGGGHSKAILEKSGPLGRLLAIDLDPAALRNFEKDIEDLGLRERVITANDNFANLKKIVEENNFGPVNGVLLDLGFSSVELEEGGRGFSFQREEPLDMRFDPARQNTTAADLIKRLSYDELSRILWEYGEERDARKIAKLISEKRKRDKIRTTTQLTELVLQAKFKSSVLYPHHRIHPATKVFQALRIAVNEELDNLKKVLPQAIELLEKDGNIAVISFHSLEDRIVKHFFREQKEKGILEVATKKPVTPAWEEIKSNPRGRSAKLRIAKKI